MALTSRLKFLLLLVTLPARPSNAGGYTAYTSVRITPRYQEGGSSAASTTTNLAPPDSTANLAPTPDSTGNLAPTPDSTTNHILPMNSGNPAATVDELLQMLKESLQRMDEVIKELQDLMGEMDNKDWNMDVMEHSVGVCLARVHAVDQRLVSDENGENEDLENNLQELYTTLQELTGQSTTTTTKGTTSPSTTTSGTTNPSTTTGGITSPSTTTSGTTSPPTTKETFCPSPPDMGLAIPETRDRKAVGDSVRYTCPDDNYTICEQAWFNDGLTCLETGQWEAKTFNCSLGRLHYTRQIDDNSTSYTYRMPCGYPSKTGITLRSDQIQLNEEWSIAVRSPTNDTLVCAEVKQKNAYNLTITGDYVIQSRTDVFTPTTYRDFSTYITIGHSGTHVHVVTSDRTFLVDANFEFPKINYAYVVVSGLHVVDLTIAYTR